jgi:phage-related protein (TIGR01555 family)
MKTIRSWLAQLCALLAHGGQPTVAPTPAAPRKPPEKGNAKGAMARRMAALTGLLAGQAKPVRKLVPWAPAPGVVPAEQYNDVMKLANDSVPYGYMNGFGNVDNHFQGFPYLSQLAQLPEYRKMASVMAEEMTRDFVKLVGVGDDVDQEKIVKLEELLKRYKVAETFREAIEKDAFFGRCQIYLNMAMSASGALAKDDPVELESLLALSDKKVTKNSFKGLKIVEPMWSYPGAYNAVDPLADDYYEPELWFVMGKQVHKSRLLMIIANPVPDILKAAYSFGGISLTQLAQPYVDNWIRTRNSVGDAIHNFSTSGIKTNLASILSVAFNDEDPSNLINRMRLFTVGKDNNGMMMLDKDNEDFFQFNMPLGGLDKLQAQAQEHMCSVSSIPLVKFTGISPTGLNASSDGEIRVFYDFIHSRKERVIRPALKVVIDLIQLSEFGEIDESIGFEFPPLYQQSEEEKEKSRKARMETDTGYVAANVLSQQDIRTQLVNDPDSPYAGLDEEIEEDDVDEQGNPVDQTGQAGKQPAANSNQAKPTGAKPAAGGKAKRGG